MQLNKEQKQAVEHSGSPLLVSAGPGSGKTRVIVERIQHLIKNCLKPSEILCLTFSEKAAQVMKDRLDEMKIDTSEMQISTFHSFCHDILLQNVLDSGIGIGSGVINRSSLLVWALKNIDSFELEHIEITNNAVEVIEAIIDGISTFKDELINPEELREYLDKKLAKQKNLVGEVEELDYLHKLEDLHRVYVNYRDHLRSQRFIDFDDMVVLSIQLFRKKPIALASYQNRFRYVLVDEFQDNNFAQFELVKLLTSNGNVTVVGDDDQSIYRFQGAYDAIFDHFRQTYPNHTEILLPKNYRSPSSVVKLSSQLLEIVPGRNPKKLEAVKEGKQKVIVARCNHDMAEVEYVIDQIREILETKNGIKSPYSFKDIAILSRKRVDGKKFAQALNSHGIPATFVGEAQIFSSSVGRDLLAYLQIASDPAHAGIAINRILKIWGINEQDIAKINHNADTRTRKIDSDEDLVFEVMTDLNVNGLTQIAELKEISTMLHAISNLKKDFTVSETVFEIMMRATDLYKNVIRTDSLEDRGKQTILKEIYKIVQQFEIQNPDGSMSDFIEYLRLLGKFDVEMEEGKEIVDSIQVSTIHQSKGKEFPFVFVVDVAQRKIPLSYDKKTFYVPDDLSNGLKRNIDGKEMHVREERRLLYVAMTRAIDQLYLVFPQKYAKNKNPNKPSPFLEELDYENNPMITVFPYDSSTQESLIQEQNRFDVVKKELQEFAIKSVDQMHLKTAIARIVDLARAEYYKKNKSYEGFDTRDLFDVAPNKLLESQLADEKILLINKNELTLSASRFGTYIKCPLQFKYEYILKIPTPTKTYFDMGSAVHAVAEQLTILQKNGTTYSKKEALEILEKSWSSNAYLKKSKQKESQDKKSATEMVDTLLEWLDKNPNKVKDVEKEFYIEICGVKVSGRMDRVEVTPDGEYEIVDFKSGRVYLTKNTIKEDPQMNLYALGVKKVYGKLPQKASLFYIKDDKKVEYNITSDNVNNVIGTLEQITERILKEDFTPTPSKDTCFRCDFKDICDFAENY